MARLLPDRPSSRFRPAGPHLVEDRQTGLIWQQNGSEKPLSRLLASPYLDDLNRQEFGGRHDWRLPTLGELSGLLTPEKNPLGLYLDPIFDPRQHFCWSATFSPSGGAYGVLFLPGTILAQKLDIPAYIRGVAGLPREPVPDPVPTPALVQKGRELLFSDNLRRVPRRAEMEEFLAAGGFISDVLLTGRQLYFLATDEWLKALIRLFRHLGVTRVMEVGAGDGFVAAALKDRGFPIIATDPAAGDPSPYDVVVHPLSHLEAVEEFRPELAFWCWPPYRSPAPEDLISHPGLRFYLDIGDGGIATGTPSLVSQFRGRYLHTLSSLGFTWLDVGPYRHNRNFLFRSGR